MAEQSVFACLYERDWQMIGGGWPQEIAVESGLPPRLLAVLADGGASAAALDERLAFDGLSTRFLELACAGVPWPLVLVLRERTAKSEARVPWAADVLHINECRVRLWYVLRGRMLEWRMARVAVGVLNCCGEMAELGNALYVALLTSRPFTTFAGLAAGSGANLAKLEAQWDMVFGAFLTRHEFVQRVLLSRGLSVADGPAVGSRAAAALIAVPRSTLDGVSDAVLGLTFVEARRMAGLHPLLELEVRLRAAGVDLSP